MFEGPGEESRACKKIVNTLGLQSAPFVEIHLVGS
jgi:hypothetical protein